MRYTDGFVVTVPKKNLDAYRKLSRKVGKIWKELGALDYKECAAEDLRARGTASFRKVLGLRRNETVVFGWIVYKSRRQRDHINAKIPKDPRIQKLLAAGPMPFDPKRMLYGGFQVFVDA